MLQILRELAKSWVFKSLMVLLIISFGIWGIGDMFRGNPMQRTVAKVGKIAISVQSLEHEFQAGLPEARRVFGPELTAARAREIGVLDRTLNIMIEHASFDQELKRLGISINDQPILAKLAAEPQLRNKEGKFDAQLWRQVLAKSGFTERSFLDIEKRNASRRLLLHTLVNDLPAPQTMIDYLYRARGAKRILEVLTLKNDSMKNLDPPDEEILREFHKQHSDIFSAPEYRAITIVRLSTDDITKDIAISEEDLKKAYDAKAEEFVLPEQRDFVQVILQDETKANALAQAAKAANNLSSAAKAHGLTPVDLNGVDEKSVLPELYTSLFSITEGQIAGPVKSAFGWHVVQLKKINPGGKQTFEEVKEKLRSEMQREQSADNVARLVNQLDDSLAAGNSLEEISDSLKLRMIKIPAVDKEGIGPDSKEPPELPFKETVLETAFAQAPGETSQVLDDKKGNYYVVRTDEVNPAHVVPFEQVMNEVLDAWKKAEKAKLAAVKAEEIANQLRSGAKTTSFATQQGMDVRLSKPISLLGDVDPDLPAIAFPKILQMKPGDVITASSPSQQYILRLADIIEADPAKPDEGIGKVAADIRDKMPYELVDEYSKFLHKRFPVKINEELLESLRKQGS